MKKKARNRILVALAGLLLLAGLAAAAMELFTGIKALHIAARFVRAALAGEPLKVYGDGQQSRCFCHVADVVRALRLLIPCEKAYGVVCNIGSQTIITIEDLAKRTIARLGSSSQIERIPYEAAYGKGFEDMRRRRPDISRIGELTGWKPEKDLDAIIDDVAAYFRAHADAR